MGSRKAQNMGLKMDNELIILKKYKHSHIIEERDLPILDKYNGLITYHLNKCGKWFVNRQILLSHPLTKFIYNIFNLFSPNQKEEK